MKLEYEKIFTKRSYNSFDENVLCQDKKQLGELIVSFSSFVFQLEDIHNSREKYRAIKKL